MNRLMKNILTLLSVLFILNGFSQTNNYGEDGKIESSQIIVEKNKKIELPVASRKFEKIDETIKQVQPAKQEYDLESSSIELNKLSPKLRVLKIGAEKRKPQLGNFAELGFGNYVTPYLGLYLNSTQNKQSAYGINFNHISSSNGPVEYAGMSNTELGVNGEYYMKNTTVSANLDYDRQGFGFYGFNADSVTINDEDSIRQILNIISSKIGVEGKNGLFNYSIDGIFSYLSAKNNMSDLNVGYNANLSYELADKSSIIVSSEFIAESFSYDTLDFTNNAYSIYNDSRTYFTLNPSYKFLHNGVNITAGINTAFDDDTLNGAGGFHKYPNIFFNYPLLVHEINVFGGVRGGLERNSITSLLDENRFFLPIMSPVFNNNNTIEFFGGLQGNFNQRLGYKAQMSYRNYKNLHFFINNPFDSTYFSIISDKGNTNVLTLNGEISYEISNLLTSSIDLEYNSYVLSTLNAAFFRPNMIVGVNLSYNVANKLMIKPQINYVQGLKGYDVIKDEIVHLNDIIDLNIEIDYKISDNFSSFVLLNNLAGAKYQNYLNYPTKGLNAIIGVSYSF